MCESEVHGLPGSGGSPSVERLNAPSPDREEPTESPRDSLVTKESEAAQQDLETPAGDALETPGASEDDLKLDQVSTGSRDPAGVTPASSKESIVKKNSDDEEGIDPFSVKTSDTIDALLPGKPADRRGSKTVNFKDPEVEETPIQNGKETVTSSPSSTLSRSSKDGSDLLEEEGTSEKQLNKHRALGEGNPVYRLSMKLSPNLFNMTDIPGASQHREAEKAGYLTKLSGRSFPYIPQWKRRYCVLAKGRLYYYEREDSKAGEKTNGVINLEYFDHVAEAGPKDCKKATNVFIITSQDRSFFDPGRHLFSADTLPDMKDWIRRLQSALEQIRNNNRPATSTTSSSTKESGKRRKEENQDNKEKGQNKENLHGSTKEKKKKKTEESHRSRKPGVSSETQTPMGEVTPMKSEEEAELKTMTSPRGGVQLPGLMSYKGFQLPGMSAKKEPEAKKEPQPPAELTKSTEGSEDLPQAGPILPCVTKLRVKGPQGRRAPQSQRRITAAALKKRASSLSALEYQDINDNRSESSQGQRGSSRDSQTPENELEGVEEEGPQVRQVQFDDIDDDIFFKPRIQEVNPGREHGGDQEERETRKEKKRSSTLKVNFDDRDHRRSTSRSRNGTLLGSKFSRIRETMVSIKRNRYESKEPIGRPDHPDDIESSRWNCSIL